MQVLKRYFKKIHNHLDASFNRALRRYGLTSTQFDFLIYLMENSVDHPTLTDLASHFGVRHTSAIHVLKILQDKGFIEPGNADCHRRHRKNAFDQQHYIPGIFRKRTPSS